MPMMRTLPALVSIVSPSITATKVIFGSGSRAGSGSASGSGPASGSAAVLTEAFEGGATAGVDPLGRHAVRVKAATIASVVKRDFLKILPPFFKLQVCN